MNKPKIVCRNYWNNSTRQGGCIGAVAFLWEAYNKCATAYWIDEAMQNGQKIRKIHHAYFVPPHAQENQLALNTIDNGYEGFPHLTIKEVQRSGEIMQISQLEDILYSPNRDTFWEKYQPLQMTQPQLI
jgi:hypothetical protein